MSLGELYFKPELYVDFHTWEGKKETKCRTYIEVGKVYSIVTFEHTWKEGVGKLISIDYNNKIIRMDCSHAYDSCIKDFNLNCVHTIYEIGNNGVIINNIDEEDKNY